MKSGVSALSGVVGKLAVGVAAAFSIGAIVNFSKASVAAYKVQMQNEVKLATVLRQRTNATNDQIQAILDLTAAEQKLGIVGDEVQISGLQQLATFVKETDTIKTLLPAMNDLIAQQYGFEASADSARGVANLMGKVLQGQTGALRRMGITFTEAQEQMMKYGTEAEKAATLAEVITQNVGKMNTALAQTDIGRQKQLSNTLGDIREQFGQAINQVAIIFLPLLQKLASILQTVATQAKSLAGAIASVFGAKSNAEQWKVIQAASEDVAENIGDQVDEQKDLNKEVKKTLAGFDEIQILSSGATAETETESVGDSVAAMTEAVEDVAENSTWNKALEWITERIDKLKSAFAGLQKINWSKLSSGFKRILAPLTKIAGILWDHFMWAIENVFTPLATFVANEVFPRFLDTVATSLDFLAGVYEKAEPILQKFYDKILIPIRQYAAEKLLPLWDKLNEKYKEFSDMVLSSPVWDELEEVFDTLQPILEPVAQAIIDIVTWLVDYKLTDEWLELERKFKDIEDVVGAISALMKGDFDDAIEHLKNVLWDNKMDEIKGKWENFLKIFTDIKEWFDGIDWDEVAYKLGEGLAKAFEAFISFKDTLVEKLTSWWDNDIKPFFSEQKWKVIGDISAKGLWDGFVEGVRNILATVTHLINNFVDGWNSVAESTGGVLPTLAKIPEIEWTRVGHYKAQMEKSPLANGNIAPTASQYLAPASAGISGNPYYNDPSMISRDVRRNATFSGGGREIVLEVDGREFGRAVIEQSAWEKRRIGTRLAVE